MLAFVLVPVTKSRRNKILTFILLIIATLSRSAWWISFESKVNQRSELLGLRLPFTKYKFCTAT